MKRLVLLAALLCLAFPMAPVGAQTTPVDPALAAEGKVRRDAAIKAHGGDAFLKLRSFTLQGKGEVTPPGVGSSLPLDSVTMSVAVPGRVRLDVSTPFGPIAAITPGNGAEPFLIQNGAVLPAPAGFAIPDPMQLLRTTVEKSLAVAALPAPADGKALSGFSVRIDDKRSALLFVDAETHLVRRIEIPGATGAIALLLGDYKTVEGIPLPGRLTIQQGAMDFLTLTFTCLTLNRPLADALFEKPGTPKP